jgi:hypothetical protein
MRRPLDIYDIATALFWISLHMRKIWFSFFYQCRERHIFYILNTLLIKNKFLFRKRRKLRIDKPLDDIPVQKLHKKHLHMDDFVFLHNDMS